MALASCRRKPPGSLRTIQFGTVNTAGSSPYFVASEAGYFRDAGIDFVPQLAGRSADCISLTASGRLQATAVTIEPAWLNIAARGLNMRIVLGRDRVTPGCGVAGSLYVRKAAFPHGSGDVRAWADRESD